MTYITDGIYENIDIKFRESVIENIIKIIGQEQFDMLYDQISINLTPESNEEISQIVKLIEYEYDNYDIYSDAMIENLVVRFFVTALRGQTFSPQINTIIKSAHSSLLEAVNYIQQHYAESPSLKETAENVYISEAYLSRLFTSHLNTTYSRFLNEVKLSHAMELLVNSKLTITEIAAQSGYANSNYFSDTFKKIIGISPLKYRKNKGL